MGNKGIFISFEGIDGAGKSTHIDALAQSFKTQGRAVTQTREPGGTALGEQLRALILTQPMDAMTEVLLVFAARREHLQQVIVPALERAEVVLCDRFTDATFAYQGGGRGFALPTLTYLEKLVQTRPAPAGDFILHPDLTLWFELDPALAAQRLAVARAPDKFESEPLSFFKQVSQGYEARLGAAPQRFARIAAAASREAVWRQVLGVVQKRGWLL